MQLLARHLRFPFYPLLLAGAQLSPHTVYKYSSVDKAMKLNSTDSPSSIALAQLLRRNDVWRGHSQQLVPQAALNSGYEALNAAFLHGGWPLSCLIEVCQQSHGHSEWQLMTPALRCTSTGYIVLLNPPATPFAQGFIQAGIDLERVLVVQAEQKTDFLASFTELARAEACEALLAWQPQRALSYTELRKCLLAAADGCGFYVLFRDESAQKQSSPAVLRLTTSLQPGDLQVHIFKQKGLLQKHLTHPISLPLSAPWQGLPPRHQLHHNEDDSAQEQIQLKPRGLW